MKPEDLERAWHKKRSQGGGRRPSADGDGITMMPMPKTPRVVHRHCRRFEGTTMDTFDTSGLSIHPSTSRSRFPRSPFAPPLAVHVPKSRRSVSVGPCAEEPQARSACSFPTIITIEKLQSHRPLAPPLSFLRTIESDRHPPPAPPREMQQFLIINPTIVIAATTTTRSLH
jgi:hypothetical protein